MEFGPSSSVPLIVNLSSTLNKSQEDSSEKIKGKTPADDGRRAAVKDDIEDAEKKGDKKLVAKLKETTTILDRIDQKIQERKNG